MSEKQIKHLKWTLASYVYNHYWTCAIFRSIFATSIWNTCNISLKHFKQIETYSCNIRFQRNIPLLLDRMEAHRCVMFTGGSGPAALIGGGGSGSGCTSRNGGIGCTSSGEGVTARIGEGNHVLHLAGPAAERRDSEVAARCAWQGQRPSTAVRRRPHAAPGRASGCALGGGMQEGNERTGTNEWAVFLNEWALLG
jgi:hypothetical protein